MKKYRRIEITAFQRRVTFVSGKPNISDSRSEFSIHDAENQEPIEPESNEDQIILAEAKRLLEEKIVDE